MGNLPKLLEPDHVARFESTYVARAPAEVRPSRRHRATPGSLAGMAFGAGGEPEAERIVPMQTYVVYNPVNQRLGSDGIKGILHNRVSHNTTQRKLAAFFSGYEFSDVKGWICNHHVPYAGIKNAVFNKIQSWDLAGAVAWMTNLKLLPKMKVTVYSTKYKSQSTFTLGAQPVPSIPNTGSILSPTYNEVKVNTEIDDLVYNLANDPRNLFYWPNSTGDDHGRAKDWPKGSGGTTLKYQKKRLSDYDKFLEGLGLVLPA